MKSSSYSRAYSSSYFFCVDRQRILICRINELESSEDYVELSVAFHNKKTGLYTVRSVAVFRVVLHKVGEKLSYEQYYSYYGSAIKEYARNLLD